MLGGGRLRGTGRLKYFCQICTKQCKDEHGWTCHINSASHKRKVQEFAENPEQIIQKYSEKFQTNILQILRDKYSGKRVKLAELFKQFIDDRTYIDINMTRWKNLDEFWRYLKDVSNIEIEGGHISWKQTELGEALNQVREYKTKNQKSKEQDNEWKFIQQKIKKNILLGKYDQQDQQQQQPCPNQNNIQSWNNKIQFNLLKPQTNKLTKNNLFDKEQADQKQTKINIKTVETKKLNNMQKMMETLQTQIKQNNIDKGQQIDEYQWIVPEIQVKILPHQIDTKFHNKKANITKIHEPYVAELNCDGVTLRIDQTYLQSVIPKPGNQVKILVGKYKGQKAILQKINAQQGFAILAIGDIGLQLSCDQISKIA